MQIPKNIIIRKIGKYVHLLNPYSAQIITLYEKDFQKLQKVNKEYIDNEILSVLCVPKGKHLSLRAFRSKLVDLGAEYKFPTIVNIEITRRCLLDCKHCYISSEEHKSKIIKGIDNMTPKEVGELMKNLYEMGVFLVVLTGGEPMISKSFSYFLKASKKYPMIIEIFSCLQLIHKDILKQENNNIGRFQISIYSIKDDIHDEITNKKGSLSKSIENIKTLKQKGYYIEVATPLMKLNYKDRKYIKKYFNSLGIEQDFSWPIFNEYYTEKTNKSDLNVSKDEFLQFTKENPSFIVKCTHENEKNAICVAGLSVFSLSADGSVFPCSQFPMPVGNIFQNGQNIKTIYDGITMEKVRKYEVKDIKKNDNIYNFCMGNNFSETGDPLKQPLFIKNSIKYCLKNLDRKEV